MPRLESRPKYGRDIDWVYKHLETCCEAHKDKKDWCAECVKVLGRPPSGGALSIWKAARKNPERFHEKFVPLRAAPKMDELQRRKRKDEGAERSTGLIEEFLKAYAGEPIKEAMSGES